MSVDDDSSDDEQLLTESERRIVGRALTEEEINAIADRVAKRVLTFLLDFLYRTVGKNVLARLGWAILIGLVSMLIYLAGKNTLFTSLK